MAEKIERLEMQGENLADQVEFFEKRVIDLTAQKTAMLTAINATIEILEQSDNLDSHEYEIIQWALKILLQAREGEIKAEAEASASDKT